MESSAVSQGNVSGKDIIMKRNLLRGASIAHVSCFTFLLVGSSELLKAGPTSTSPDYSVAVFANAPSGLTNPYSITSYEGTIFVAYINKTIPTGGKAQSTIVQFSPAGQVLQMYQVVGQTDRIKYNPVDHKIWCLRNEDAHPALTLIEPKSGSQVDLAYAAPTLNGGGYDDVVFLNGQNFLSASNPKLNSAGQNIYPSIVKVTIVSFDQVYVSPVLMGNATLTNITSGKPVEALQSDPESLEVDPSGNLILDSRADGDLIFLNGPGFPNQVGYRLHVSDGSATQVTVDDTVFPTRGSGTIYVADTPADIVYAVTSTVFPPNSAFSTSDTTGVLARADLQTGKLTSIITGMMSPHGALFVPNLPEVRLEQATTSPGPSGGLTGTFTVFRTGDTSQPLQVFMSLVDSSQYDPTPIITLESVTIPVGQASFGFKLMLDSKSDFKQDHDSQAVKLYIAPDPNYNVQANWVDTGLQTLSLPLPN